MRRREFIAVLGGAMAWPLAAGAQRPAVPVIGYLSNGSPELFADRLRAFRQSLSETGFVEGRNVAIDYRWAGDEPDRLPALAADLVRRQVNVISAFGERARWPQVFVGLEAPRRALSSAGLASFRPMDDCATMET
jgi:putative tryptophan/tyrosine transport system substrate-binding protein